MPMFTSLLAAAMLCNACTVADGAYWKASAEGAPQAQYGENPELKYRAMSKTGAYLSSRIARLENDWEAASYFYDDIVNSEGTNLEAHYQAMLMAMNAGRYDESISFADFLVEHDHDSAMGYVIAIMGAVLNDDYPAAQQVIAKMPKDSLEQLIKEPIAAWVLTALNDREAIAALDLSKPFVAYQAIVAADNYNADDLLAENVARAKALDELPPALQRHLSSIFARRDLSYPNELLKADNPLDVRNISDIRNGFAWIYYDLAMPLYLQYQDETGRLLFNMSLAMAPDLTEARIRVAEYAAMSGRTREAIAALKNVSPESRSYPLVQKIIAELMVESGEIRPALDILEKMAAEQKDINLYVQIGGIYAKNEMYSDALEAYNKVLKLSSGMDQSIFWHIYFARGRIYDAMGKWPNAEKDLLQALEFEPEQPFLLNYIGYSWADRGINLDKALTMIEKAVELEPNDGAIQDSLGWVYFRLGVFDKATIHLEKAAALMPYDPVVNDHLGDAYWQVGRRAEAEFQWKRALSNADAEDLITTLEEKLSRY